MAITRSANPALNNKTFQQFEDYSGAHMTLEGTVNKTYIMLFLVMASAFYTWDIFIRTQQINMGLFWGGLIGGLIVAMIVIFKKTTAPYLAPVYAVLEGLMLGGISAVFNTYYPGIVVQAIGLTFTILFSLLLAYKSGWIKVTENFKLGVVAATGGILLIYVVNFIMGFFGSGIGFIHSSGPFGIIFSLVVVGIASLNLVLDFDFIEHGAEQKAPKYMEWYGAFGLIVTLVWLYLEILHLLSKMRN